MGKHGLKASKTGKKWRKGESCTSNPKLRKNREEARLRSKDLQKSGIVGLTAAALSKHNEESLEDKIMSDNQVSNSATSSVPFSISGLTDCTNLTFEKVHKLWLSPLEEHKQICAVLAAVTEVIRSNGGKETETEYFAALVVALQSATDVESISAIVFLINLVIKRLPQSVIRHKFSEVSKLLVEILGNEGFSEKTSLLKNLLCCLSNLIRNQDSSTWQEPSTRQLFQVILSFTVSGKPKVRKTAQIEVASLLKISLANTHGQVISSLVTKFCLQFLQENATGENMTVALHILNLLKTVLPNMPSEKIKSLCEAVMNLMKIGNVVTKLSCFQTLDALFAASPPDESMPVWLNGKIISALYDFQPSINDVNVAAAWLRVMQSAHINFSTIGPDECLSSLPRIFGEIMAFIMSDARSIVLSAADSAKRLIEDCLVPLCQSAEEMQSKVFKIIFRQIELGLKYKYQQSWDIVINLISLFFKNFGMRFHQSMVKCLVILCDLHNSENITVLKEIEGAVSAAIRNFGPRVVLQAVPLNLIREDKKCDFPKAWILSLMKDNIEGAELQFFVSHFLPVIADLRNREIASLQNGQILEGRIYQTLQQQVWSLLPGFFNKPIDFKESFKNIARVLGKALENEPKIRLVVLQSLRTAISKGADSEEEIEEMKKYSKNYLPILFNLYLSECEEENDRMALPVLETIKSFVRITDQQLIKTFVENAHGKLAEEGCSEKKRNSLMDLIAAMIAYSTETCIKNVYEATVPLLQCVDVRRQKKAYRILEEICEGRSESSKNFIHTNLEDLKKKLFMSMSAAVPSSKAPRLRCLNGIVRVLTADKTDFLISILPEVILCTKANNVKAKAAAFALVEEIGNCFIYHGSKAKEESVSDYMELVMAGLATSSNMVSASLRALAKISFIYKEMLEPRIVEKLLLSSIGLLRSKDREVMKSALSLSKALISLLDCDEITANAATMVKNLFDGKRGNKNLLRMQSNFILQKLIRKIGFKIVHSVTPPEHQKFVVAINKSLEKRKTNRTNEADISGKGIQRSAKSAWNEFSSDEEPQSELRSINSKKSSGNWIIEKDVVDLLDSKIASNISGTEPTEHDVDNNILMQDGKLVIKDIEQSCRGEDGLRSATSNDDAKSRKRKFEKKENEGEASNYKPGGKGIHRAIAKKAKTTPEAKDSLGMEYKAKKADGDIKIRGKLQPFAYLPLDHGNLNARKRAKVSAKFHGIIKAKQRGAKPKKTFNKERKR